MCIDPASLTAAGTAAAAAAGTGAAATTGISAGTAALIASGLGAAATVGGTLYNASQQSAYADQANKAKQAQQLASEQARQAEAARQKVYDEQSMANWQDQLAAQGPQTFGDQVTGGAQSVLDTTKQISESATPGLSEGMLPGQTGSNVSKVFTDEVARQGATRGAEAKDRIAALATLAGFDRAGGYERVSGNRFKADQGLLSGMAGRSLALGQQEGNVASPYVDPPDTGLAKALTGLGGTALQYGAYKGTVDPNAVANLKKASGTDKPGGGGIFSNWF
jgi:hypothetical protein